MKKRFIVLFVAGILIVPAAVQAKPISKELDNYVCKSTLFRVPAAFDMANIDEARLLVKANPKRFEAHVILAAALVEKGLTEEALREFRQVETLASKVEDQRVLASLPYEDLYAFTLFVNAEKRFKAKVNTLGTLRLLQQIVGMDTSRLERKQLLSRCYLYLATLYLKRGIFTQAIKTAETGKEIASREGTSEYLGSFDSILGKARPLEEARRQGKLPSRKR